MVLAILSPLCLEAQGLADIIRALREAPAYMADATYSVSLPSRDDDVTYRVHLSSIPTPADTLSPCAYHIGWELDTPNGPAEGWTAYFDGNLYRFRDHRLREYHTSWDIEPFRATAYAPGIQGSTQFVELTPAYIARDLQNMLNDSLYTVSAPGKATYDGRDALRVDATMDVQGERVRELSYWFDAATFMPMRIDIESNPASITEQTILIRYTPAQGEANVPMSEEALIALYPEQFEKYRESNFRIENLRDTPLPSFSLPSATGERYTYRRGDAFRAPTVLALIDPATGFCSEIVRDLRSAIESSPVETDIIWAVPTTNTDVAEETTGPLRPGEHLLINARSLARDCGAASLPVVIIADKSGTVKNVILGYNSDLPTIVIQSIALSGN